MCLLAQITQNGRVYLVWIPYQNISLHFSPEAAEFPGCVAEPHRFYTILLFLPAYVSIKVVSLPKPQRMRKKTNKLPRLSVKLSLSEVT